MIEYRLVGYVRSYAAVPRGAVVTAVNGREVFKWCESCGKPIFEGKDYLAWSDGVYTCHKCSPNNGIPAMRVLRGEKR